MRLIFALIALFSICEAWACELTLPKHVLVTGTANGSWPFAHENCSHEQINEMHSILIDQDGMVPVARLQAAVGSAVKINTADKNTNIEKMDSLIRRSFSEVGDADMNIGNPFQGNLIAIPTEGEYVLHCHPCQFTGEEVLRLHVKSFQNGETDYSFQTKFARFVMAYKVRQTIPAFTQKLSEGMFELVRVPAAAYGQYLTDLSTLNFYKTNKTLRSGDIVRTSDLVPQTLVKAGDRVDLIFENNHVRLKSQALSRQNGGVGDSIEVWNQATGKKYVGTVIDHKRVVVEL